MNKIINIIKNKKVIPLDQFINIALYDKKHGFYMKKNPFKLNGDFITSPLISNLFSEMIAIWCVSFWESMKKPKKIIIVEMGPGNGSLCNGLLKTFKNFSEFYDCLEINLIEKSEKLKQIQKRKIKDRKVKWINKIEKVNKGPIIFLCNEFFDALPIKQIYKKSGTFLEKYVTIQDKKKIKFYFKKAKTKLIKNLKKLNLISLGTIIEYPAEAIKSLKIISKKIKKFNGGILIFDYGYTKKINKNTLQSIKKHRYSRILDDPGNADITSHINFSLFSNVLKNENLKVEKVVNQSEFLQKLGIIERADILAKKMTFKEKANMFYRLKKLLDYKEMGSHFKVMLAKKKGIKFNLGL